MPNYQMVVNGGAAMADREAAFRERIEWVRAPTLRGDAAVRLVNPFIEAWSRYGVITQHPHPAASGTFPDTFWRRRHAAGPRGG